MNIHEYQAKTLLSEFGVAVPRGEIAFTPDEATAAAKRLGGSVWVVKAQIHAGGRGKGGGIQVVDSVPKVTQAAVDMLGMQLVTHQTGPQGKEVKRIYIEEGCDIARELYLGILIDRSTCRVSIIASTEGGMDIEQVAKETPEKIIQVSIDPAVGFQPFYARKLAFSLGFAGQQVGALVVFLRAAVRAFCELDASLLEINPLVVTNDGSLLALDAKMNFDSNGLFRQPKIVELRDRYEEAPAEMEASEYGLTYIKLGGSIGCMVNGAGLAMATMDIIKLYGGDPANFLDVGGGATAKRVAKAFKIILYDTNVKGILVNIFGGIMRCDVIAQGIVDAAQDVPLNVPLVVRLEGTNAKQGRALLANSGLSILTASNLDEAAKKAVHATTQGEA